MYGYEIYLKVKDLSESKILLKDGSLYPALQKLTSDGLLSYTEEEVNGRRRKYYYITETGLRERVNHLNEIRDFIETLSKIIFPRYSTI